MSSTLENKERVNSAATTPPAFSMIRQLVVRTRTIFSLLLILGFLILGAFSYFYTGYRDDREFKKNIALLGSSVAKSVEYFDLGGVDSIANAYSRLLELDYLEIIDAFSVSQITIGEVKPDKAPDVTFVIRNEQNAYLGEARAWRERRFFAPADVFLQITANVLALISIIGVGTIWMQKLLKKEVVEPLNHLVEAIDDDSISIDFKHDEIIERRIEFAAVTAVYRRIRETMREAVRERDYAITRQKLENMRRAEQVHLIEEALSIANMSLSYLSQQNPSGFERFGADVPDEIEPFLTLRNFSEAHIQTLVEGTGLQLQHIIYSEDQHRLTKRISSCEINLGGGAIWRLRFMDFYVDRIAIFAINIANERAMEKMLHQKNKMEALGVVASGVAHDINNILAIISTALEQLSSADDDKKTEITDIAMSAVERGSKTVKQLLQFAHVSDDTAGICHLETIHDKLQTSFSHFLGPHIQLTLENPMQGDVIADGDYLESILFNLCINARDAINSSQSGGHVHIDIRDVSESELAIHMLDSQHSYIAIDVKDNGSGVPPNVVDRIFDPFYSTKPVGSGTGLGLSMAYDYLNRVGGTIYIKENRPGRTCFTVLLRKVDSKPKKKQVEALYDTSILKDLDILVVDDERNLGELVKSYLERLGMNVSVANSVTSATEFLKTNDPDIVLSDMHMPDGFGQALLMHALEKNKNTLGILMSGNIELDLDSSSKLSEQLDEFDILFLYKPFKLNDLKSFLVKSVHQHKQSSLH